MESTKKNWRWLKGREGMSADEAHQLRGRVLHNSSERRMVDSLARRRPHKPLAPACSDGLSSSAFFDSGALIASAAVHLGYTRGLRADRGGGYWWDSPLATRRCVIVGCSGGRLRARYVQLMMLAQRRSPTYWVCSRARHG